jgi:hypothetical protein
VPIVDVTHGPRVTEEQLVRIGQMLPHAVSLAVECPEEPYDEELQPGDVEIRFRLPCTVVHGSLHAPVSAPTTSSRDRERIH